jgi:hypothetical protein
MKAAILGVGTAILTGFVGEWIKAAEEARQADQRLEKVAKTIDVFGKKLPSVTERLKEFADQQEIVTGITAEEIKAAQTKILTYTAVAKSATKMGGIFDRTTMAAIDLAATGFGSVEANADTLGKALANPLKGLAALQKQGFVYSEEQKKQFKVWIDQGKLWKAQEFILKDIESQVQGVAEASGSSLAKFQNAIGQVTDAIGEQFLPLLDRMVDWFKSPSGKKAIQSVIDQVEELGEWFASKKGQDAMKQWAEDLKVMIKLAGDFLGLVRNVASLFDQDAKDKALSKAAQSGGLNYLGGGQTSFMTTPSAGPGGQMSTKPTAPIQYINIKSTMTANEIAAALNKRNKSLGLNGF